MDIILNILGAVIREMISPGTAAVAIAVIGLNLHFGYTGLLNFGQSGFMLLGAYGFAISLVHDLPIIVAVLIGLGVAFLFALVLGIPTLQLRGDYLAIVTISAAEIIRFVGRLSMLKDLTGGAQGIQGRTYQSDFVALSFFGDGRFTLIPFNYTDVAGGAGWARALGGLVFLACVVAVVVLGRRLKKARDPESAVQPSALTGRAGKALVTALVVLGFLALFFAMPVTYGRTGVNGWWVRAVAWTLVAISTLIIYLLVRSPWGRLLRGIREDEDAMRSLGRNVFMVKMQSLVIGGLFGALGGMVYVLASTVQPDALGRQITFFAYTALLLGGAATIFGPVLGTIIFFSARILVRELARAYVPDSIMGAQQTEQFSFVAVGIALVLLVIFRPQGILGDKRELRFNV
ncbi:branched-chain amino acid ABC transporter permease [Nocardioides sp. SYSU DS0663]|uniref:branched-chain amino acid ABC transporter permease n=1 Tax=Nocardioides sp. SYSU DS0663 TaxID=3416445 RepID=UPI003F4B67C9